MTLTLSQKHADEIREMWQSRALRESTGKLRKVVIVALAKAYPGALQTLLKVTFPNFIDIDRPIYTSYARISLTGKLMCDMIDRKGEKHLVKVYESEDEFTGEMRRLADGLKLNDADRVEMFGILQKWVVGDKRVGVEGQRLAS